LNTCPRTEARGNEKLIELILPGFFICNNKIPKHHPLVLSPEAGMGDSNSVKTLRLRTNLQINKEKLLKQPAGRFVGIYTEALKIKELAKNCLSNILPENENLLPKRRNI